MSTNIQIDVVLRKLQEQSEQIKAKNKEQRSEREEEAELARKKAEKDRKDKRAPADNSELTVNEPGQSPPTGEQLKKKEADSKSKALNSTDPDIARTKEEPAGFVAGALDLMFCGYRETSFNTTRSEIITDHTFYLPNQQKAVVTKKRANVAGSFDFTDPATDEFLSEQNIIGGPRGSSAVMTEGTVILPLGGKKFMFCYFVEELVRVAESFVYGSISPTGDQAFVQVRSSQGTSSYELCVLVGPESVKEVPMPQRLLSALKKLYPMPATEDYTIGVFTRPLADDYPGGVPFLDLEWDWLFFVTGTRKSYDQQGDLYGHYLDDRFPVRATPAVYWWLQNATETDLTGLNAAQIRESYKGPKYGFSKGDRWYYNDSQIEAETRNLQFVFSSYTDKRDFADLDKVKPAKVTGPFKDGILNLKDVFVYDIILAWDGNLGPYCTSSALALGFRKEDLTFGEEE